MARHGKVSDGKSTYVHTPWANIRNTAITCNAAIWDSAASDRSCIVHTEDRIHGADLYIAKFRKGKMQFP